MSVRLIASVDPFAFSSDPSAYRPTLFPFKVYASVCMSVTVSSLPQYNQGNSLNNQRASLKQAAELEDLSGP
eukprot:scaffold155352_cov15-Prasinocladus_malaysianus.AAC.1